MSYLWHLDELSMALRLAIYGIFAHGSHRTHGFFRFIRDAKNILWDIDDRVVCGNLIHGIDGIGMRCDT